MLISEIHFLEDFLDLEKIRRDPFACNVCSIGDLDSVLVPPLLFITFVENAVKHNLGAEKPSFVHLQFNVQNDELQFKCINSKPQMAVVKNDNGGLGLANVTRRLNLLYPSRHRLDIGNGTKTFFVTLTIKL